jgi:hypothetical protein
LNMPIFFLHSELGIPGLRVARGTVGNPTGLMNGRALAPVGNGCWASIRINVSLFLQAAHRVAVV